MPKIFLLCLHTSFLLCAVASVTLNGHAHEPLPASMDTKNEQALSVKSKPSIPNTLITLIVQDVCSNAIPDPAVNHALEYECKLETGMPEHPFMEYTLELIPLLNEDFNGDGNQDIALEVRSSGPMGASITTDSSLDYLLLDGQNNIKIGHTIQLYAPFSDHIVEYQVIDNQIHYTARPNFRRHPDSYDDVGNLLVEPKQFVINWHHDTPVSSYYQNNCQLAHQPQNMLLKPASSASQIVGMDRHNYEQTSYEEITLDTLKITATATGCDKRRLRFEVEPTSDGAVPVLADVLQTLFRTSHKPDLFAQLIEKEKQLQIPFGEVFELNPDWTAQIHIHRKPDYSQIIINLAEQ